RCPSHILQGSNMAWRVGNAKNRRVGCAHHCPHDCGGQSPPSPRGPRRRRGYPAPQGRGSNTPRRHRVLWAELLEPRTLLTLQAPVLVDINALPAAFNSSLNSNAAEMGGKIYFAGAAGDQDYELWKTDGTTAGTVLVKDISPIYHSFPNHFVNVGG